MCCLNVFRQVRRATLTSLADVPTSIGQDISPTYRLTSFLGNISITIAAWALFSTLYNWLSSAYGLSTLGVVGVTIVGVIVVTLLLYAYYVYFVHLFARGSKEATSSSSSSTQVSFGSAQMAYGDSMPAVSTKVPPPNTKKSQ